ncbi:T9SS type A sorting domain-containing protein [Luteibaculum oceani]|nr:T9SS type A sorting domain-containing protein [Luteibaculum oceani]
MIWSITDVIYFDTNPNSFKKLSLSKYYFFDGDTLIDDTLYDVLKSRLYHVYGTQANGDSINDSTLHDPETAAFFFDDINTEITFMRLPEGEKAFPRYFWNPEVGDTIRYHMIEYQPDGSYYFDLVVDKKDTVEYFGEERYWIEFEENPEILQQYFITGLGGGNGLIHHVRNFNFPDLSYITCMSKNGEFEQFYSNQQNSDCHFEHDQQTITNILNRKMESFAVELSPNPVNEILSITYNNQQIEGIQIISNLGIVTVSNNLRHRHYEDRKQIEIDFSSFPSGLYIVNFTSKNGSVYSRKVVKR